MTPNRRDADRIAAATTDSPNREASQMNSTKVDHYAEAEHLLDEATEIAKSGSSAGEAWLIDALVARANVHALLALTDAQAREADADEVMASAVDPESGRRLRIEARA